MTRYTDMTGPIVEAGAALQRFNESLLLSDPESIGPVLDALARPDGPLDPIGQILDFIIQQLNGLDLDGVQDVKDSLKDASNGIANAIEFIQDAANTIS